MLRHDRMVNPVTTEHLKRRFGATEAVAGLTLTVPPGATFALIGPNGAGKTTTLKLLLNLLRPTSGGATVLGRDSRSLGASDLQRIGYVSENQRLPDWMTPAQLLEYTRAMYPTWDHALATRLQETLRLTPDKPLRHLSRGTRMKAALLASLAYRPELLILDEPFTGLDPLIRDELIVALQDPPGGRAWTVLVSSHDIQEVERLADWVGFIDRGRMTLVEPTVSLMARFRLVEVTVRDESAPTLPDNPEWILQGSIANTLRFVDANHREPDASARLAAAFPNAEIRIGRLSLREIFVALATRSARTGERE
jgi:ABC-2 type transport system ATP-binding protein